MRWGRNIFAVIATGCLALWFLSFFYVADVYIPMKRDSGLTFGIYKSWTSFGVSHGGTPNRPRDRWQIHTKSLKDIHEQVQIIRDIGVDLPVPEELLTYGYDTFDISHPAGKWKWYGSAFVIPTWLPPFLFGLLPSIAFSLHIQRRYFTELNRRQMQMLKTKGKAAQQQAPSKPPEQQEAPDFDDDIPF